MYQFNRDDILATLETTATTRTDHRDHRHRMMVATIAAGFDHACRSLRNASSPPGDTDLPGAVIECAIEAIWGKEIG